MVCGKINTLCLDKTGTITEDTIRMIGYAMPNNPLAIQMAKTVRIAEQGQELYCQLFASCHNICLIDNKMLGDTLDQAMFQFSGWELIESQVPGISFSVRSQDRKLDVLKVFEFESSLQRQSSLVHDTQLGRHLVFTKGAPEILASICLKSTIPTGFQEYLDYYTQKGYRILSMAYKEVGTEEIDLSRPELEADLQFMGFIIFENKIKDGAQDVLSVLQRSAELDCKIISGKRGLRATPPHTSVLSSRAFLSHV